MKKIETVKGTCPNCNNVFVIPKSVEFYECICGKLYQIKIKKNEYPIIKK